MLHDLGIAGIKIFAAVIAIVILLNLVFWGIATIQKQLRTRAARKEARQQWKANRARHEALIRLKQREARDNEILITAERAYRDFN